VDFLNKLQKQPEHIRRLILWSIVAVIGLGLAIWWIDDSYHKLKEFEKEKFIEKINLPDLSPAGVELPSSLEAKE